MKKSLLLFFLGVGLVGAAGTVFAQGNNLYLLPEASTPTFNAGTGPGGPARAAGFSSNSGNGSSPGAAANNNTRDGAVQATFNAGSATLAGALTLLLLQRRYRDHRVLRPRS